MDSYSNKTYSIDNMAGDEEPIVRRFCLPLPKSDLDILHRNELVAKIQKLGGEVQFDTKSSHMAFTHLIMDNLSADDNIFLRSLATGKWVLHSKYIKDSFKKGTFIKEEPYEHGNKLLLSLRLSKSVIHKTTDGNKIRDPIQINTESDSTDPSEFKANNNNNKPLKTLVNSKDINHIITRANVFGAASLHLEPEGLPCKITALNEGYSKPKIRSREIVIVSEKELKRLRQERYRHRHKIESNISCSSSNSEEELVDETIAPSNLFDATLLVPSQLAVSVESEHTDNAWNSVQFATPSISQLLTSDHAEPEVMETSTESAEIDYEKQPFIDVTQFMRTSLVEGPEDQILPFDLSTYALERLANQSTEHTESGNALTALTSDANFAVNAANKQTGQNQQLARTSSHNKENIHPLCKTGHAT